MTTHENLHVLEHPLLRHKLAILRDRMTETRDFRNLVSEIAGLMCYEATRDFPLADIEIETPICKTRAQTLAGKQPVLVPILRAGLGMVDGILALLPAASIGHIGLYRDEQSMEPVEYYCKLPSDIAERDVLLLDPMLATGGSAVAAVSMLKQRGVRSIRMLNIVAAPEGVAKVHAAHPDLPIYCAALDEGLNAQGYIVPGLGDAGDRIFGTK